MRIIGIGVIVIGFLLPQYIQAAELRLVPTEIPVRVGQPVGIVLNVDTPSDKANAFELEVQFDATRLSYSSAADATAVTSFWIQYPHGCKDGTICLSGMVPGGFIGLNQELVTLYFVPKELGTTTLAVDAMRLLAHDGKGTSISIEKATLDIVVEDGGVASAGLQNGIDIDPPEPFALKVSQHDAVEDGAHVLIFSTNDKQSSVVAYYVKEYSLPILRWLTPWKPAESPYILKDQSLKSTIEVKAVDSYGNERISYLTKEYVYTSQRIFIGISLVLLLLLVVWRNRNRAHKRIGYSERA